MVALVYTGNKYMLGPKVGARVLVVVLNGMDLDIAIDPKSADLVVRHAVVKVSQMLSVHRYSVGIAFHVNSNAERMAFMELMGVSVSVFMTPVLVVPGVEHNVVLIHSGVHVKSNAVVFARVMARLVTLNQVYVEPIRVIGYVSGHIDD